MWIGTCKAQRTEIQGLNERLNNPDRFVFCDEVFKPFRKQGTLISLDTLDKKLYGQLTQNLQCKYIGHHVFTRPVSIADCCTAQPRGPLCA